jgi:hypothetical protein
LFYFSKEIIMKTSRIAALALIASAAAGFNAYAGESSEFTPNAKENFVSTLTRAQVQAEAVQAVAVRQQRGYSSERDEFLFSAPASAGQTTLTREAVRAEAIKARGMNIVVESNS